MDSTQAPPAPKAPVTADATAIKRFIHERAAAEGWTESMTASLETAMLDTAIFVLRYEREADMLRKMASR